MQLAWRKLAATAAVVIGLGAVGSTAANAAYTSDCGSGYHCVYNQTSFQDILSGGHKASGFGQTNLPSTSWAKMSSWENHSGTTGAWYDGQVGGFGNLCYTMNANTVNGNIGLLYNDSMESWQGNGGC